jgi:molybdopterin/thiamine biosynthesis adenylyltransferase
MPDYSSENIVYNGIISTRKYGDVEIDFLFDDDAFVSFPEAKIGIDSQNKFKPFHFPHIDNLWNLCYHDYSRIFDRYDPEGMVRFCIENTQNVLNETIEDDMEEIKKEFPRYWCANDTHFYSLLVSTDTIAYIQANWIVSPNIKFKIVNGSTSEVQIFKLPNTPSIANIEWPLEEYTSFQSWINRASPETERKIQKYIRKKINNKLKRIMIIIFLMDINIYLGFTIEYLNPICKIKAKSFRQKTVNSIFDGKHIFHRFTIDNYDAEKIIKSNIPLDNLTFINKKILLIGAGTIGSNLSNLLVKNGAGIGESALFTIVDGDRYEPYNYSRHFLGIKCSGNNKALALKEELEYTFPFIKIDIFKEPVQNIIFGYYDIVIDSTGEESLTQWLNEKVITNDLCGLFISAWVHGQGIAAECLVIPDKEGACHECLRKSKYYSHDEAALLSIRDSCNSIFIPFPVTASMYVVLLIIHVLNKWFKGELAETTFFTQKLNPVGGIEEILIAKNERCPFCGIN